MDFPCGVTNVSPAAAKEKKKMLDRVNVTNPGRMIGSGFWAHWSLLYY